MRRDSVNSVVRGILALGLLLLTPPAKAHILAIAGAAGFDDQPFISLVQQLAADEQAAYLNERPANCTIVYTSPTTGSEVMKGPGYTILLRPTGEFAMAPDWPLARTRLQTEIANFRAYLQSVDMPCECREYLHIVGFSDGASTIGGWLNLGATNTQAGDDFYGVVALIDVIRQFNNTAPNTNNNATWTVSAMPAGRLVMKYTAYRNKSGGTLACLLTANWAGHQILTTPVPWMNSNLNQQNICHPNFPNTDFVRIPLSADIQVATFDLITNDENNGKCNCVLLEPMECPDFDNDGDVDLADYTIMAGNFTGPTSGRGGILGDIDADGDVDLRDFSFFQRAFSGS